MESLWKVAVQEPGRRPGLYSSGSVVRRRRTRRAHTDGGVAGARPAGVAAGTVAGAATALDWPACWNAYGAGPSLGPATRVKDPGVGDGRRRGVAGAAGGRGGGVATGTGGAGAAPEAWAPLLAMRRWARLRRPRRVRRRLPRPRRVRRRLWRPRRRRRPKTRRCWARFSARRTASTRSGARRVSGRPRTRAVMIDG